MGYLDYGEGSGLEIMIIEDGSEDFKGSNTNQITAAEECKPVFGEHILTVATFMLVMIIYLPPASFLLGPLKKEVIHKLVLRLIFPKIIFILIKLDFYVKNESFSFKIK